MQTRILKISEAPLTTTQTALRPWRAEGHVTPDQMCVLDKVEGEKTDMDTS